MPIRSTPARRLPRLPRLLAVALVAALSLSACGPFGDDYAFQGSEIESPTPAPALSLTDQHDQPFDLAAQRGKAVLVFFGYTHCPDVCPTTLSDFITVKDQLGDAAEDVAFVFVTVDPARDTAARLAEYLDFFDPSFVGLTGTTEQIDAAKQGYGVYAQAQQSDSSLGYLVDHTTTTFLIDPDGNERLVYSYGTDPAAIVADVNHLVGA